MYQSKYQKYKSKYINSKKMSGGNNWPPNYDALTPMSEIQKIQAEAHKAAYDLLIEINKTKLQIASAESLTAGLIFSVLVDIPFAGANKYGNFGVYDTDAKRAMLGVQVKDVYTHLCAKEMAVGVLKNSNATIAIAVTGNAMPYKGDEEKLGEVFIGIAGYTSENEISVSTKSYNFCKGLSTCKLWNQRPSEENNYSGLH